MSQVQIIISVSGGLVQDVYCSVPDAEVTLVDFDVEGSFWGDPGIVEIVSGGRPERVFVDQLTPHGMETLAGTDVGQAILAAGELVSFNTSRPFPEVFRP